MLFPAALPAQVAGGNLSGTITDPSGRAVPQAQILIKNVATGVERTVTTNTDGFYTAVNLLPGDYEVTITAQGFNTEVKTGITMNVGAQQTFDLALHVGTVSHRVEVTTDAPAVQLTSSDIGATVNATTVRELPLNGRSWTDLAALQPGVDTIQTQPTFTTGADRGNRGFGQQLTISGARPQQNNYRLDGISLNDYANGAPGSVLGGNLGVDAIQEFSVLTSNYSAEYGKTSGGVVNAVTRSGTNAFHGSVYEFLRNSALDARNFFEDPTVPKAPFKRNQFGGAIGGPIIKNHTFFFADYEGIRQSKGIAEVATVPSNAARSGTVSCSSDDVANSVPGCTSTADLHTVTIDPSAQKYLALYPVQNGSIAGNNDLATFTFAGQQVVNENFLTTRVDHKFTDRDSIFGTYLYDKTPYTSPDGMNNVLLGSTSARQIVAVEETHSFTPTFVNAVRFGFNHEAVSNNQSLKAINPVATDMSLGSFSGRTAAQVQIGGGASLLGGGVGGLPTYLYTWNSFQAYDDAFVNRGTHTIKFGFTAERMLLQATALTDPNGIWQFSNVENFLTNVPSRFQGGIVSTLSPRDIRQSIFGGYVQDDWRWRPNLTLNLGLRYEMTTIPTEVHGKLANLRNLTDAAPHLGDPFFTGNPTSKNFEPRIGFAWDPFRNGRMAVRGGAGLFDVLPLPYQFILLVTQAAPFFEYTSIKSPGNGTFFAGVLPPFPANKLRQTYTDPSPKRNYVTQWNLNVQYQLTSSLAAMAAYVGSRGVHQPFRVDDADTALPTLTSAGYVWDPNASRLNDNYGSIRGMFYQGRSYFNALELQLAKRMSHGFQVQGTFTWGKSMDTSSATVAGDAFGNSISSLNWFDMRLTRGLSDFNVGRTLVVNGTWAIPTAKSFTGPARWISDGWELGLILTVSDGVPFTPTWGTGDDPALTQNNDDWAFPNRLGGSGCQSLTNPGNVNNYIKTQCFAVPTAPDSAFFTANNCQGGDLTNLQCFNLRGNAGRNILIGPGITNLDFSIFKNNHIRRISENFNVQFRAEVFNILNHPNFAPPTTPDNSDIFLSDGTPTGAAGLLTRTTIPERQIQFAIKFIF
ncbi:MAG TPA: TonB-dependent receptor, partial [Terriglobia bacterium]|nr:TonB-dependent receptor [Terriglobia bacterium]